MQLSAATALGDLRPLVLGDHPLELAQQLVLRGARALRLLREDHLDPRPLELLEQQHLIRVTTREAVRRVTQQHLEPALDGQIAHPLERRPAQHGARDALVLEHQIFGDQQPAPGGELTQRDGLTLDRLLATLAVRGHPRVDRGDPRRPRRLPDHAAVAVLAHHSSARCRSHGAARAPRSHTPAPAARRRAGHQRTRSQRVWPPGRSPA
jgi:hypothetical protein